MSELPTTASINRKPDLGKGLNELRSLGGDYNIRSQSKARSGPCGEAVHLCNHWFFHFCDLIQNRKKQLLLQSLQVERVLMNTRITFRKVLTSRESPASPGKADDAYAFILRNSRQRVGQ